MATIIPAGYAQVLLGFTSQNFDGGNAAVTLGFGGTLGDDPTSLEAFALEVGDAWIEHIRPLTDVEVTLDSVLVLGPTASAFQPVGSAGAVNGSLAPPNVTVLVNKTTAVRGRRARGRSFWPGLAFEDQIDQRGVIQPGSVTALQSGMQGFIANLTDPEVPGVEHVVLQSDEGVTPPITPPPVVTAYTVQALVSTQRRRLRR